MTAPYLEDRQLLLELEPVVARQLDRHLTVTKDWMPHEYVPWSWAVTSTATRTTSASPGCPPPRGWRWRSTC